MLNVIQEYLVSLGFDIDTAAYNKMMGTLNKSEKGVTKFANAAVSDFAAATAAVTGFVVAANVGIAKFLTGLAKADTEASKFAMQMWTSKENAVALNNTLKAMGVTLEDLWFNPELMQNFIKLRQEAFQLVPPAEYKEQMKFIRSIIFEFQRFKLELTYAAQWVGYYLIKYLHKPLEDLRLKMKGLNDKFKLEMPHITKQIAQVISWFGRLGIAAISAGGMIIRLFRDIPKEIKIMGSALMGAMTLLKMGPIGWLIVALMGILALIDDFNTYKQGGESLLGWLWKDMDDKKGWFSEDGPIGRLRNLFIDLQKILVRIYKEFKESGLFDKIVEGAKEAAKAIFDLVVRFGEFIVKLLDVLDKLGLVKAAGWLFKAVIDEITGAVDLLNSALELLTDLLNGDVQKGFEKFGKNVVGIMENGMEKSREDNPDLYKKVDPWAKKIEDVGDYSREKVDSFLKWIFGDPKKVSAATSKAQEYITQMNGPTSYNSQSSVNNRTVTQSNTVNVYGSDANATGKAVTNNLNGNLLRTLKGVFD